MTPKRRVNMESGRIKAFSLLTNFSATSSVLRKIGQEKIVKVDAKTFTSVSSKLLESILSSENTP